MSKPYLTLLGSNLKVMRGIELWFLDGKKDAVIQEAEGDAILE